MVLLLRRMRTLRLRPKIRDVAAIALLAAIFSQSQLPLAHARSFGEVMQWCTAPKKSGDDRLCDAYVSAGLELFQSNDAVLSAGQKICLPPGTSVKSIIPTLAQWLKLHPETREQTAAPVAAAALANRYPCH
jgi:hypothetical protein